MDAFRVGGYLDYRAQDCYQLMHLQFRMQIAGMHRNPSHRKSTTVFTGFLSSLRRKWIICRQGG